ncbi:MAG: ATP-binding protein [Candidatus Eremiobacterota bacterium]
MIEEVFDNLVDQFSDPYTFYRELIQNSMDAGSNRVEVTVEYRPDEQQAVAEVTDFGEGMNQQIIHSELTRIFSSSKENDLTKIGKFGIGFLSVFAIVPTLVVVDTGRGGEYWRIVFRGDTNFECLRLESPVEGTRVRLYKPMPAEDFEHFSQRSKDTIRFWCRFSDTEVYFNGVKINDPLTVESPCQVVHRQPGTEIVAGVTSQRPCAFGMYNRGLTLKEGAEDFFPGVTFRIKSRYLEHTLTRDNVMQDENYRKALKIFAHVVRNRLAEHFFQQVGKHLDEPEVTADFDHLMGEASTYLAQYRQINRKYRTAPLFPTLHGQSLSLSQVRWAAMFEGAVYMESVPTRVSQELARVGIPVVKGELGTGMASAVEAVTGRSPMRASHSVAVPLVRPPEARRRELGRVAAYVVAMLRRGKANVQQVRMACFDYPGSVVQDVAALIQPGDGVPIRLYERGFLRSLSLKPGILLLNEDHPLVVRALAQGEHAPLLSSFVLAKAALLNDGLPSEIEAGLVGQCLRLEPA